MVALSIMTFRKRSLIWAVSCWLFAAWLGLTGVALAAGDATVTAHAQINRVQIMVGDWIEYELVINTPTGFIVDVPPVPTASLGEWEVRECVTSPTITVDGGTQSGWRCTLTIWEVGYHALPTQIVKVVNSDDVSARASTQPLSVEVVSVLDEKANNIKPLKPQLIMNEQANYLLIIGLTVLAILLLGLAFWAITYYRNHRPVPVPVVGPAPVRDPVGAALAELERIAKMNLVAENRIVDHYALIADVLRRFIADRYSVPALERTTSEVRAALTHPAVLQRRDFLLTLLGEADSVKFARQLPGSAEAITMLDHARQAIIASR